MPRSVWTGAVIAAAIFATIYLVISVLSGDRAIGAAELAVAAIGGLTCGAVGLAIGAAMWRRGQRERAADR